MHSACMHGVVILQANPSQIMQSKLVYIRCVEENKGILRYIFSLLYGKWH